MTYASVLPSPPTTGLNNSYGLADEERGVNVDCTSAKLHSSVVVADARTLGRTRARERSVTPGHTSSLNRPLRVQSVSSDQDRLSPMDYSPRTPVRSEIMTVPPSSSSSSAASLTSSSPSPPIASGLHLLGGRQPHRKAKNAERRHSCIPSSLPASEMVSLRMFGQRRYSSARREDSLTQLLAQTDKPIDPRITCWLNRSWVRRQRMKAVFFRGILLGCVIAVCVKLLVILWRFVIFKK